jgi:hypothetical protein
MEVTPSGEKKWHLTKNWIRPISHRPDGALNETESKIDAIGHQPRLLDIVEVDLSGKAQVDGQPEDWLIEPKKMWRKQGRFDPAIIDRFIEEPNDLWLEMPHHPDRVSPQYLKDTNSPSLYLIRPETFQIFIRDDDFTGQTKKKRRGIFTYRGVQYDLPLTDPKMQSTYFPGFPNIPEGPVAACPEQVAALCISLTPVFASTGCHHKLVAAVFV